jgi:dTDP-4-dehydrorhamnose reductase
MSILVTGARGMLGFDLCNLLRTQGHQVVEWDLPERDVSDVTPTITEVKRLKPKTIFHLAAYTDVDGAEQHRADAYRINTMGTWTMAIAARDSGAELVFISTDYVFDGAKRAPYLENDKPNPLNYYGTTKLLGEQAVEKDVRRHYICRTSWLYGRHGRSFVDTIIGLAREKDCLEVVGDQQGSPTYTRDLASALTLLIGSKRYGTYHVSNSETCTWYQFAQEIVRQAGLGVQVRSTTSNQSVRPARRPGFSVLDNGLFQTQFGHTLRPWNEALRDYLKERGLLKAAG